jgi:transposase
MPATCAAAPGNSVAWIVRLLGGYKRFARWEADGTWARIQQALQRDADAAGELDWRVQADSSVVRAHQHAAGAPKGG